MYDAFRFYDAFIFYYRFKYKDEYEKFKLVLSIIGFVLAILNMLSRIRYVFCYPIKIPFSTGF